MKYLLDTNICIYLIKKRSVTLLARFQALEPGDVAISCITVAELTFGVAKSQRKEQNRAALEQFLLPLAIVEFEGSAALIAGEIRATLEAQGQPIGSYDLLIAAQALAWDIPLVTNNGREFERVPGLRVENWI